MALMKLNQESLLILMTIVREATYLRYRDLVVKKKLRMDSFPIRFINMWNSLSEDICSSKPVLKFKTFDKFILPDR